MTTFYTIAQDKGWTKDECIQILLEYIETFPDHDAFESFFAGKEGLEPGMQSFLIFAEWPAGGTWAENVIASDADSAGLVAKELMTENSGAVFDRDEDRQRYMNEISILDCMPS